MNYYQTNLLSQNQYEINELISRKKQRYLLMGIYCMCVIIPISIISIILGITKPGSCDITDDVGLDVGNYLLGVGIVGLSAYVPLCIFYGIAYFNPAIKYPKILFYLFILQVLFNFTWFLLAETILFRSNVVCIREGSSHVIFALIIWCIFLLNYIYTYYCNLKYDMR
jgi:hypothetical protein